ncbi:insulinase family protein [Vreelandella alkaliphila]|uniref:insulinase family protein n=1 Tax=Vreelandella alkaliphila TaxID=272774 RepID=UPI0030828777
MLAHAPHITRAHISIAVAAGYLDEPTNLPGLAHLLEHVLTTEPLEASSNTSLLTWFAQHQGSLNAHTDDYVTDVHFSIPTESLETAALTVASQLATPTISPSVIRAEVAAIDAEWRARQHSSAMQRLSAVATLSDPQHIGAGCRHGNAQVLSHNTELLHEALTTFHRSHYHGSRVCIAIISPWEMVDMTRLAQHVATLFNRPPPNAPALTIAPRWGRLRSKKLVDAPYTVEFFWPLPPQTSHHQLAALSHLANTLNQGHLVKKLPSTISDYHASASPNGATDSFSVQLNSGVPQEQLKSLAADLSERLSNLLATTPEDQSTVWQPPADTVQLAPVWFAHTRRQALARRFAKPFSEYQPVAAALFTVNNARWLINDATTSPLAPAFDVQPAPSPAVQCWCGQHGVHEDFNTLADDAWAACFVPDAVIVPSSLTAQRLALEGIVFKQEKSPHGSWVIVVGSKANNAMLALLEDAVLSIPDAQEGLLAQQLVQRLTPLPATSAVWVSHQAELDTISQALAALTCRSLTTTAVNTPRGDPSAADTQPANVAVMRTLSLPGSPAQRWLLAAAEKYHSATFFQQARYEHRLGYVAAVRRGDGAPCSLGYVVQTSNGVQTSEGTVSAEEKRVEEKLISITNAIWQTPDKILQAQLPTLTPPETPLAALILQWQSLLAGTTQPLHRLGRERTDQRTVIELLTQVNTHGRWQTHWLDSAGHYFVSD